MLGHMTRLFTPSRMSAMVWSMSFGKAAKARDPVLVILDRVEPELLAQFIRGLNAAPLIDREQVLPETETGDVGFEVFREEIVIELVGPGEAGRGRFCVELLQGRVRVVLIAS